MANSKHYNPHTFDPQQLDYQQDVRLAVRDEIPDEVDASDIAENLHNQVFMGELLFPPVFFGTWSAFEPDVSKSRISVGYIDDVAHLALSMGKGTSFSNVQR